MEMIESNAVSSIGHLLQTSLQTLNRDVAMVKSGGQCMKKRPNANLILEMAKTASTLSTQLLELHSNLSLDDSKTTPCRETNFGSSHFLTPISSGYNSLKTSKENISCCQYCYNSNGNSSFNSSAEMSRMSLNSGSEEPSSSNSGSSNTSSSIKTRLFNNSTANNSIEGSSSIEVTFTPFKQEMAAPKIPRIKERRIEISKKKRRGFYSLNKMSLIRKLSYSSMNLNK
jgi:hypothetical protein